MTKNLIKNRDNLVGLGIFLLAMALGLCHLITSLGAPYYASLYGDALFFHQATRALLSKALLTVPLNATLSPVYLATLSFPYRFFPEHSLLSVRIFQIILNAGTCFLIYRIAKNIWNFRTALFAGILSAFCGVFIFYSLEIAKSTLVNFFFVLALYCLFSPNIKSPLKILMTALLWMHACLLRMNLFLFSFWILFYLFKQPSKTLTDKITKPLTFILIAVSVSFFWNAWMASNVPNNRSPMSQWGIHFYIGNQSANTTGHYKKIEGVKANAVGHSLGAKQLVVESGIKDPSDFEINKYWFKKGMQEIFQNPKAWIVLSVKKCLLFINAYEAPSYDNFQYVKAYTPFLKYAWAGAWLILPLGFLGLFISLIEKQKLEVSGLQIFIFCYLVSIILTFMRSDYRLPVYPILLLFCGFALDRLLNWIKVLNIKALGLSLTLFACLFYFANGIDLLDSEKHLSKMQKQIDRAQMKKSLVLNKK